MSQYDMPIINPPTITVVEFCPQREGEIKARHIVLAAVLGALVALIGVLIALEYSPAARHAVLRVVYDVEFVKHDFGAFLDTCQALPKICPANWIPKCNVPK